MAEEPNLELALDRVRKSSILWLVLAVVAFTANAVGLYNNVQTTQRSVESFQASQDKINTDQRSLNQQNAVQIAQLTEIVKYLGQRLDRVESKR